jgi:hypothetical protein
VESVEWTQDTQLEGNRGKWDGQLLEACLERSDYGHTCKTWAIIFHLVVPGQAFPVSLVPIGPPFRPA